jgi:hypothetical protein
MLWRNSSKACGSAAFFQSDSVMDMIPQRRLPRHPTTEQAARPLAAVEYLGLTLTMRKWRRAMQNQSSYLLPLTTAPDQTVAEKVYDRAWRFDFTAPGFCLLDAGSAMDSHTLRVWMVTLKQLLSDISIRRTGRPFFFRSMARFDQKETTKFHLDGAPEQSMLMLGYEPSKIQSRLFLGDYARAAFDLGISPQQFLQEYNPMFSKGEEALARYVTELPQLATESDEIGVEKQNEFVATDKISQKNY